MNNRQRIPNHGSQKEKVGLDWPHPKEGGGEHPGKPCAGTRLSREDDRETTGVASGKSK